MILGLNEKEYFASGHRACPGCGQSLAVRHVLKAAGENTIIVNRGVNYSEIVNHKNGTKLCIFPYENLSDILLKKIV